MGSLYLWGRSIQEMGGDVVIGRSIYGVVVVVQRRICTHVHRARMCIDMEQMRYK